MYVCHTREIADWMTNIYGFLNWSHCISFTIMDAESSDAVKICHLSSNWSPQFDDSPMYRSIHTDISQQQVNFSLFDQRRRVLLQFRNIQAHLYGWYSWVISPENHKQFVFILFSSALIFCLSYSNNNQKCGEKKNVEKQKLRGQEDRITCTLECHCGQCTHLKVSVYFIHTFLLLVWVNKQMDEPSIHAHTNRCSLSRVVVRFSHVAEIYTIVQTHTLCVCVCVCKLHGFAFDFRIWCACMLFFRLFRQKKNTVGVIQQFIVWGGSSSWKVAVEDLNGNAWGW